MNDEMKFEIIKLLLVCANERQKDCNHLHVGNYVAENLEVIKMAFRKE